MPGRRIGSPGAGKPNFRPGGRRWRASGEVKACSPRRQGFSLPEPMQNKWCPSAAVYSRCPGEKQLERQQSSAGNGDSASKLPCNDAAAWDTAGVAVADIYSRHMYSIRTRPTTRAHSSRCSSHRPTPAASSFRHKHLYCERTRARQIEESLPST